MDSRFQHAVYKRQLFFLMPWGRARVASSPGKEMQRAQEREGLCGSGLMLPGGQGLALLMWSSLLPVDLTNAVPLPTEKDTRWLSLGEL